MSSETRIGTEVGGYRLESVIGRGGMSVIYLAEQLRLGRKVAFKLLAPELARDERFRERFLRESRLASTIEHPNIIQIHDAGEADGLLYIAMRHVEGPSLKELIARRGALGLGRVIYIVEQIASALDVAHAKGLVHRDVKPANILLDEASDHAFLTDFGIAKQTTARGLTSTAMFIGTMEYCSPEQIEGRPVDARTDVYGLGCVVVESLTGSPPFVHETEVALMHAHLSTPAPMLTSRQRELPIGLNAVVARALAKDPDARYQTAGEFAAALREGAVHTGASAVGRVAASDAEDRAASVFDTREPQAASAPLASDAQETGSPSTSLTASAAAGRPRRKLTVPIAVAAALLIGIVGAAAGILLTRSGSSVSGASPSGTATMASAGGSTGAEMPAGSSTQSATPTGSTDTGMSMTTAGKGTPEQRLAAFVSGEKAWTCSTARLVHGAMKTLACSTLVPEQLKISVFDSKKMLDDAYVAARRRQGGPPRGTGRCSPTGWRGEGNWLHGKGEPGGRYFCYLGSKEDTSHIVWTSTVGVKTLYDAVYRSPNHRTLFYWWVYLRHELF